MVNQFNSTRDTLHVKSGLDWELRVHQILFVQITSSHLISLTSELPVIGESIQSGRQNSLTSAWPSKEELPRSVKAYPSLSAEPTGGNLGNVKQGMAAFADQFGPVPIKERPRWLTNLNGMRHSSQAIGASLLLVAKCPIR